MCFTRPRYDAISCTSQYEQGTRVSTLGASRAGIAEGAEHIKWQREVVDILERISACAEATEGARALLTILLETQAQREQDRDRLVDCNSCSTVPLAQPVDHRTDLELPAQHEQDSDQIPASLDGDVVSPSTVPLAQPVDHRTDLELPAQREQDGDQIPASLDGDVASPSTVPLAQPVDHWADLDSHQAGIGQSQVTGDHHKAIAPSAFDGINFRQLQRS